MPKTLSVKFIRGSEAGIITDSTALTFAEIAFATDTKSVFITDAFGSKVMIGRVIIDLLAYMPAAGVRGRFFFAEDIGRLFLDTGTKWTAFTSSVTQQIEIDFGNIPVYDKTFIVPNININQYSIVSTSVAYVAPTGRDLDEVEMEPFQISVAPGNGQMIMFVRALEGPVYGKYRINYQVA